MLLRQTQTEVEKLGQRELQMSNRIRDMELNLDNYSRQDMKAIYNGAQETQMRLFMMRSQVDQLQARKQAIKTRQAAIAHTQDILNLMPDGFAPVRPGAAARADSAGRDVPQLELAARVIQAQEDERLRISRALHDGPAQTMSNLVLRAEICERAMDVDATRARAELASLKSLVGTTLQDTRRFIFDLRPMILDDLGLEKTLRQYIRQWADKTKIEANLSVSGLHERLPSPLETSVYRIVQDALSNVTDHAHAAHVQVNVDIEDNALIASVEDDGSGFNVDNLTRNGDNNKALGIASMRQRAEMLGGQLLVESLVGRGTKVTAAFPL
jgi:two-component system sensor histidine kinase DegS